jgi:hypothetical protein
VSDTRKSLRVFLKQFAKIESIIISSFTRIQVLKLIADQARDAMSGYYNPKTQDSSTCLFKTGIMRGVDRLVKHVDFSGIDFEKMLCSLLLFSRGLEVYLARKLGDLLNRKRSEYISKLSVENTIEIVGALELKIRTDRQISENASKWMVIEPFKVPSEWIPKSVDIQHLNGCHSLTRGTRIARLME